MVAFVDNDVLIKATRYGQLAPTLAEIRRRHGKIVVQSSLSLTCDFEGKRPEVKFLRNVQQRDQLRDAVESFETLSVSAEAEKVLNLLPIGYKVQPQDALWIAVAAVTPAMTVYTGDRKALVAVAEATRCAEIAESLKGRCILLPGLLLCLVERNGVHPIRAGIVADPQCDPGISELLPAGTKTALAWFTDGLKARIAASVAETKGIVAFLR